MGFDASNNEAEYEALLAGLRNAKALGVRSLTIFSDSQLVTSQLTGEYQARDDRMASYLAWAKEMLSSFDKAEVVQVGRELNSHADALANLASAIEAGKKRIVEVEVREKSSIDDRDDHEDHEIMCVDLGPSWMDPIIAYL